MSAIEINKLVAAVLVAGLLFMVVNVGVDEILHEDAVEVTVYPVPTVEKKAVAQEPTEPTEPAAAEEPAAPAAAEQPSAQPGSELAGLLAAADPAKGAKVARKCKACHDFSRGGRNKVGPPLWGMVGAPVASSEGFTYSTAFSGLDGVWGYDELFAFLAKPKSYVPGTKMAFAGVKEPGDLADLLAFLRTLGDQPPPLPAVE